MATETMAPNLTEAYSTLLDQYIEERKTTLAEVAKAHPELFGKAEPAAATMIPYDVEITYDGGRYFADVHFVCTPQGGTRPVARITTTALYTLGVGKQTLRGLVKSNYRLETIIGWEVWAHSHFGRVVSNGFWTGLAIEDIGSWGGASMIVEGYLLSKGVIARP